MLAKSRKGSKIATMGDHIAISSPVPVEREPPPLHHQPPKRREQSVGRVSDNAAKRKSGDKLEVATKRRRYVDNADGRSMLIWLTDCGVVAGTLFLQIVGLRKRRPMGAAGKIWVVRPQPWGTQPLASDLVF
jgi:hypothetical protein